VLEGDLSLVECVSDPQACKKVDVCITSELWREVADKIKDILSAYTLKDMVNKHFKKTGSLSFEI
jgi:DNA-binding IscR family transcriptional regulator